MIVISSGLTTIKSVPSYQLMGKLSYDWDAPSVELFVVWEPGRHYSTPRTIGWVLQDYSFELSGATRKEVALINANKALILKFAKGLLP